MQFKSPDGKIRVSTVGDCFVDDTEHGVNVQTTISSQNLLQHLQLNDQKHTYYWHVTGGRIAVDKCSWYHLSFHYDNGISTPVETNFCLETAPDYVSQKLQFPNIL